MGKGYKEESMDEKKRKKIKRYQISKWSVINTDKNLVDWSQQKEREKERELSLGLHGRPI